MAGFTGLVEQGLGITGHKANYSERDEFVQLQPRIEAIKNYEWNARM
jgi:hypothetical protein